MVDFAPILHSPSEPQARISLDAVCHRCPDHNGAEIRHRIDVIPAHFGDVAFGWQLKHPGHDFEFLSTKRNLGRGFIDKVFSKLGRVPWWVEVKENADLKLEYGAVTGTTITLASLATSATWVAGRQATSVSNASLKYVDYRVTAKITTGTSPTAGQEIRLYGIGTLDDTPTWPDTFGSTDAAVTVTITQILDQLPILQVSLVASTSNIGYPFTKALTLAEAFGYVPKNWTIFVSQSTGQNLNSTGGNHVVNYQGIYFTNLS